MNVSTTKNQAEREKNKNTQRVKKKALKNLVQLKKLNERRRKNNEKRVKQLKKKRDKIYKREIL